LRALPKANEVRVASALVAHMPAAFVVELRQQVGACWVTQQPSRLVVIPAR
jgi:hypothetical protein